MTNTADPAAVRMPNGFDINRLKHYITIIYHVAHHYFQLWNKVALSSTDDFYISSPSAQEGLVPYTKVEVLNSVILKPSSSKNSHIGQIKVPAFNSGQNHTSKVVHTSE